MARQQKLKVYRTPIGFHDAYVAAPSQKAALKLWGVDVDLFARGFAETVDDEALTRQPLERPGTVVRVPRGTSAEHLAALPEAPPTGSRRVPPPEADGPPPRARARRGATARAAKPRTAEPRTAEPRTVEPTAKPAPKATSRPRPSRAPLEKAEQALDQARADHAAAIARIREQEQALQQRRRDMETHHQGEIARLEAAIDRARTRYSAALHHWRAPS